MRMWPMFVDAHLYRLRRREHHRRQIFGGFLLHAGGQFRHRHRLGPFLLRPRAAVGGDRHRVGSHAVTPAGGRGRTSAKSGCSRVGGGAARDHDCPRRCPIPSAHTRLISIGIPDCLPDFVRYFVRSLGRGDRLATIVRKRLIVPPGAGKSSMRSSRVCQPENASAISRAANRQ